MISVTHGTQRMVSALAAIKGIFCREEHVCEIIVEVGQTIMCQTVHKWEATGSVFSVPTAFTTSMDTAKL